MMIALLLATFQAALELQAKPVMIPVENGMGIMNSSLTAGFSNNPPITFNETFSVCQSASLTGSILNGDYDPEGGPLHVSTLPIQLPTHGDLQVTTDGSFVYHPDPAYSGSDFAVLSICDASNACSNDTLFLNIDQFIPAIAGADTTLCESSSIVLTGNLPASGISEWMFTSGPVQPTLTPLNTTTALAEGLFASGTAYLFTYQVTNGACASTDELSVLDFNTPSVSFAGQDQYLCSSLPASTSMAAAVPANGTGQWSVILGSQGVVFQDPSDPNTLVTGMEAGMNIFDWTVTNGPCNATSSAVFIFITEAPEVFAGNDTTFCSIQNAYPLLNASVSVNAPLSWSSSGDGYFSDPTILSPSYTPGPLDLELGNALLTLTLAGNFPCEVVSDDILMVFSSQGFVSAGPDGTVAPGQSFILSGASASDQLSILWSTSGDGTFDNPYALNPQYTPGVMDLEAGSIILTIHGTHPAGCTVTPDSMTLSVVNQLYASAGPDQVSCMVPFTITEASAGNYSYLNWTHNGHGFLENSGSLAPTYHPSAEDIEAVTIELMVVGQVPSLDTIIDSMILSLNNPSVSISGQQVICEGEVATISFDLSGTAPWTLTFTDGTTLYEHSNILSSPFQVELAPGAGHHSYSILSLSDSFCSSAGPLHGTAEIIVNPLPVAAFETNGYCSGSEIEFSDRSVVPGSGSIQSWLWNFGDPSPGNQNSSANPQATHIYSQPGIYPVSLRVTNNFGCLDEATFDLEIAGSPSPAFEWKTTNVPNLVEFSYSETAAGSPATSLQWTFGDDTGPVIATGTEPITHQFPAAGKYSTVLHVTDQKGCKGSTQDTIVIAGIALDIKDNSICKGEVSQVALSVQGDAGNWILDWGDGSSPLTKTAPFFEATHTYAEAGIFTITAIVYHLGSDQQMADTVIASIRVSARPDADFTLETACPGMSTKFRAHAVEATGISYSWDFGVEGLQNDTSSAGSPVYQYDEPGSFKVRLIASNETGCADTIVKTAGIPEQPVATIVHDAACAGKTVQFSTKSSGGTGNIIAWNWNIRGQGQQVSSELPGFGHHFAQSGQYAVALSVINSSGCRDSVSSILMVDPSPLSLFTVEENHRHEQGKVLMQNGSVGSASYSWNFGNGSTSEEPSPVASFTENGTYTIELIARSASGCSDTSRMTYTQFFKGLFIPNAYSCREDGGNIDGLWKPVGEGLSSYQVQVYSRQGQLIWSSDLLDEKGSPAEGWDGSYRGTPCDPGVYVWKIHAVFSDGTTWKNRDIGNRENMPDLTTGTISLLR